MCGEMVHDPPKEQPGHRVLANSGILSYASGVHTCGKLPERMTPRALIAFCSLAILRIGADAQCPQLYDYYGTPSSTPTWYSCSGNNFTLLIASPGNVGAYSVNWGDGSPVQNGALLVPPMSVNHVYASTVGEYTMTFTEIASGCVIIGTVIMEESTSASIQIPVGGLTQICAPQAVEFINSSTNVSPNTVFTWDFGDGSAQEVYDYTNLGQTVSHTYLQGTVNCETTVTLYAENTCNTLQGGPSVATFNPIRVWDLDEAAIAPSATLLCWPDRTVTFLNVTDRNCLMQGNIYQRFEQWNFGDYWGVGQDSIIDWNPWPPTFPRTIQYPGIGTYEVTLLDSNYCGIDTANVTITIVPPPSVQLALTPDTICAGEAGYFDETTNGGANTFSWNFGDGNGWQSVGPGDQAHTYTTAGTYLVSYAVSIAGATLGCTDTATVQITVLPSPTAQFVLDATAACNVLVTDPTNTSINAVQYLWDMGDGTTDTQFDPPPHTYAATGDYTITLTATNADGCSDQTAQLVHVYAPPQVAIGAQNVCVGTLAQFFDQSVSDPGNPVVQWSWNFGDGATDTIQAPTHLYAAANTYQVSLTVTTPYCSSMGVQPVTVEAKPNAGFTSDPIAGCSPLTVGFGNSSMGATNYVWTFGDGGGDNATSPSHTYLNLGTSDSLYAVTLVASTPFGCSDTASATIAVSPAVIALFTHNALPGCAPLDVDFMNNSVGAISYAWDFGDGSTSNAAAPSLQYVNTTFFLQTNTITLIAYGPNGCADTTQQSVLVYPAPNFSFVADPDSGCSPFNVTFPPVNGAVDYIWDFGDGTMGSGPSPSHIYMDTIGAEVQFPVTVIVANAFGCSDTLADVVTVFPSPEAHFSVSEVQGCHPLVATLTNTSLGAVTNVWSYGDGINSDTSAAAHDHTWYNFPGPGAVTYPVSLTVTSAAGCSSTANAQVEVYPQVVAAFLADSVGCSPMDAGFVNLSTGANAYYWTFGDGGGSVLADPLHMYLNEGLSDVVVSPSLVSSSQFGCSDTARMDIRIHPSPIAQFTPDIIAGCTPLAVTFDDLTIGAVLLDWDFGDGAFQSGVPGDVQHTYVNASLNIEVRDVQLVATSSFGCTDTTVRQVEVYPPVTAFFNAPAEACSPFTLSVTDQGSGAGQWLWDMGDGTTLVGNSVTHTYLNTGNADVSFVISLIATSPFGCSDTLVRNLIVHPTPSASFQATPFSQVFPASTVNINNTSPNGAWTYSWDMGDGNTSSAEDPLSHTYASWGDFTMLLVVSIGGCSDTATQQVIITPPLPVASFLGQGEGCAPLTVDFTNTSLLAQSYQWNFGDGGTSQADQPSYTWNLPGTYTVTLTANMAGGGSSTAVKVDSIVVHPRAMAYFVLQPEEVVVPDQPVFTYNLSANATDFQWDFGDGGTSAELNPIHYYQSVGTFSVTLIANNEWNCPDTVIVPNAVVGTATGELAFPNAFTPGNSGPTDGVYDPHSFENDYFFPVYSGIEDYHLQVFNRWGELVFESFEVRKGWDGWYRGVPAKQDVYAWKAYAKFSSGEETILKGDVTLLR
jgi:PKD repeat protein